MKWVRYQYKDSMSYGFIEGRFVTPVKGSYYGRYEAAGPEVELDKVCLLPPCEPTKVVCIGLNYLDHATEMGMKLPEEPLIFLKPATTVIGSDWDIEYPALSRDVHYEGELAVVIKKTAKNVKAADAAEYILGYTCGNDVTARDLQKKDKQWTRGKSFDTFCPLGPYIDTGFDPAGAFIKTFLNGDIKQDSNIDQLIFKVPELVEFISSVMTLLPGDVILTGTSSGVGPMKKGDVVEVEIEGLGRLRNRIRYS